MIEIRIVFTLSKICDYFSTKDTLLDCFKSFVVYQFTCVSCRTRYVGRTHKHFDTRITEHFGSESSSIFKHLNDSKNKACKSKTTRENAFKILDDARTDYELALKEGLHIKWFKPALNKQKAHKGYYLVGLGFVSPEDFMSCRLTFSFIVHLSLFCFVYITHVYIVFCIFLS